MKIFQLKIVLKGSSPPIWRRFLVEDNISFHKLHEIIQTVMGWENCHLYEFSVSELRISIPPEEYGGEPYENRELSSKKAKISILGSEKLKFSYLYDFGDSWEHAIIVEKIVEKTRSPKCPVCIAGKMSCPPEDCGGIWGYSELLEIRKDKNHPEYEKKVANWLDEDFSPEKFEIEEINRCLN